MPGGPTLTAAAGLAAATADWSSLQVTWADYNGDGRPDLADGDTRTHELILLLNDGTLNPQATSPLTAPAGQGAVQVVRLRSLTNQL